MKSKFRNELEELLDRKNFKELSKSEKIVVLEAMTEEEYDSFRTFLHFCQSSLNENRELPNPKIKDNLKTAYRKRYKNKFTNSVPQEKVSNRSIVLNPFILIGSAGILLILMVVHFFNSEETEPGISNNQVTGMNIEQIKNFEVMIEHMSLDETCMYSELVIPDSNKEVLQVRSDTLITP